MYLSIAVFNSCSNEICKNEKKLNLLIKNNNITIGDFEKIVIVPSNHCIGCIKNTFYSNITNNSKTLVITSISEGINCETCTIIYDYNREFDCNQNEGYYLSIWNVNEDEELSYDKKILIDF